jgi:hypothetical protein
MRNVDQTFCPKLLSVERTFDLLFSHFSEHFISIKHRILATFNINKKNQSERLYAFNVYTYICCSYMRRLAIQNLLKCTETLQIFIDPHWYFILDTGLILRSIKLFIYIQTNVCVSVNASSHKYNFYTILF